MAETLATMTISALVLAGLVGLGGLMLRMTDRSTTGIDAMDELGRTLTSLDGLLQSARPARLDGTQLRPYLFNGDEHRMIFAHRITGPGGWSVTGAIRLSSEADGRLYRAEAPMPPDLTAAADLRFGPQVLVLAGSVRLRFGYVGQPGGERAQAAAPFWPIGDRMPRAVRIEALDGATGRVLVTLRSTIAADADIDCLDVMACGQSGGTPADDRRTAQANTAP